MSKLQEKTSRVIAFLGELRSRTYQIAGMYTWLVQRFAGCNKVEPIHLALADTCALDCYLRSVVVVCLAVCTDHFCSVPV